MIGAIPGVRMPGLSGAGGVGSAGSASNVDGVGTGTGSGAGRRVGGTEGGGFTQAVGDALNKVGQQEQAVEQASQAAATGNLSSITDYMVAVSQAQLTTEITVAVRDRAITAFNDIMRMQL